MSYYFRKLQAKNNRIKDLERQLRMKEKSIAQLQSECTVLEDELLFASQDMSKNIDQLKAFVSPSTHSS